MYLNKCLLIIATMMITGTATANNHYNMFFKYCGNNKTQIHFIINTDVGWAICQHTPVMTATNPDVYVEANTTEMSHINLRGIIPNKYCFLGTIAAVNDSNPNKVICKYHYAYDYIADEWTIISNNNPNNCSFDPFKPEFIVNCGYSRY